jgi:UDPglucose--hexose-1-phosphate uridylyltransferase
MDSLFDLPHRRLNPLTGEWVLVSPQRTRRPWQGQVEKTPPESRPAYDPGCYLCPGNARAGGVRNPDYESTFVFTNDFAALLPDTPEGAIQSHALAQSQSVRGTCRVICYSPRHDLTMAEMAVGDIRNVVDLWADQTRELGAQYRWVQVFENKGAVMGCSNPHPHGQIWAADLLPNEPAKEDRQQKAYYAKHGRALLSDYCEFELEQGERVILANEHWLAAVPYWAVWPFETILIPRQGVRRLPDLDPAARVNLAAILKGLLVRYDNLFETSFPYSMGWHGGPYGAGDPAGWRLHAHFYPPLLRSATVKKFLVGYEMLSEAQRDITPEAAAARLKALPGRHYLEGSEP